MPTACPNLIVNSIWGRVVWYRNMGTRTAAHAGRRRAGAGRLARHAAQAGLDLVAAGRGRAGDAVAHHSRGRDINGDGLADLVMLDQEGYLALFARRRFAGRLELLPPAAGVSRRIRPAAAA